MAFSKLNFFCFSFCIIFYYLLIIFSATSTVSSKVVASIKNEVEGKGFHRILKYHINTGTFKNTTCHIAVFIKLPSSLYVNMDELANLRRQSKTCSCAEGEVDVELFAEKAKTQDVSIVSRLISSRTTLSVPIHQRYHYSRSGGGFLNVTIPKPRLLIGCKEKLKDHRISKINLCEPCILYAKKWRDVDFEWENAKEFIWMIPVGDTDSTRLVSYLTLGVAMVGSIIALATIWKSYKNNEEDSKKRKEE